MNKTNIEKVTEFMQFGSPLNQAFVLEALDRYAKEVKQARPKLLAQKGGFINPVAWLDCAETWLTQNP